jgi:hypothetical protein
VTTQEKENELVEWIKSFGNRGGFLKKSSTAYSGIYRNFPYLLDLAFPVVDTSAINKQQLLELAADFNNKRPSQKEKIGVSLNSYIVPSSGCYDPEFTAKIKAIRPEWFLDTSAINKQQLLELAADFNNKRPSQKEKIGMSLSNYIVPSSGSYDPEFTAKIKAIRPEWFRKK